ncbi:TetR/AcrR family transcriptional regulator [Actinoallomurus spadix]|uniref:TetR family transcriptional regulator n=1 Tax=Actinoallomurus spadix TaxID=79912 RepID=A0ABN0WCA1_9ACTN|nr:TetR/AcrR family transcriptional regulator [Actinoallomurus spadix]MCO5988494.1 TetR/AcrR family transcriptional regulator [Actinoallomurus spadix]
MISGPGRSAGNEEGRTPRQERRAQTRAALLDAAERLWAERGIRGASLDEIAALAGLTKGAVYSNFASKSDLVLALLERYTQAEPGLAACHALRDSARPPQERCADVGRHYAERLSDEDTRMRALLLVELWLFGMRDFSAGWRIADWYHARREELAAGLSGSPAEGRSGSPSEDRSGNLGEGRSGSPAEGRSGGGSEMSPEDRASLAMAIEFGLALQHLLDPERVPAELYGSGVGLLLDSSPD